MANGLEIRTNFCAVFTHNIAIHVKIVEGEQMKKNNYSF